MPSVATKPIRPTKMSFDTSDDKKNFVDYANQSKKTESVGMDRIREMVNKHQDRRK